MLLTRISPDGTYLGDLLPGLLAVSFGMGLTFVPVTLLATGGLDDEDQGLASGRFNTSQQVGGALGLAVLSTLAEEATPGSLADSGGSSSDRAAALVDGWPVAFTSGAVCLAAGLVILVVTLRRHHLAAIPTDQVGGRRRVAAGGVRPGGLNVNPGWVGRQSPLRSVR